MNYTESDTDCVETDVGNFFSNGLEKLKSHDLYPLFFPRSVALVGVSESIHYGASSFLQALDTFNYSKFGNIYPVNPKYGGQSLHGYKCYPTLESLPEIPDYVLSGLPASKTPNLLKEALKKGAKFVTVFTSGFGEVSSEEGKTLHNEMISILKSEENKDDKGRQRTRVIGPNCLGVYNPSSGMAFFNDQHNNINGRVSILSQSGGQAINISNYFSERKFPVRMAVSVGNMIDLGIVEILDFYYHDPYTDAIACYVEGIPENTGRPLFNLLKKITQKKPVLIWKTGNAEATLKAISSHTGALAGDAKIFNSAMRQAGVILPHSMESLFDCTAAVMTLSSSFDPLLNKIKKRACISSDVIKDNNLEQKADDLKAAILVCGGGFSVDIIDTFSSLGIKKADFSSHTINEMAKVLPGNVNTFIVNPVDMGDKGFDYNVSGRILELCALDENVDFIVTACEPERYARFGDWLNEPDLAFKHVEVIKRVSEKFRKPILVIGLEVSREPDAYSQRIMFSNLMREINVPCFSTVERAADAALAFATYFKNLADKL